MSITDKTRKVRCCDCGTEREINVLLDAPVGWHYMQVTNRVRCDVCAGLLSTVNVRTYKPAYDSTPSNYGPSPDDIGRVEVLVRQPDPEPFKSGGGGDYAGGGADGGWSDSGSSSSSET